MRTKTRVVLNPVRMSRKDHRPAKNATVGTVRKYHLWVLYGKTGKRNPFCKWCGGTRQQVTGTECVELQQAVKQARIAETRTAWTR